MEIRDTNIMWLYPAFETFSLIRKAKDQNDLDMFEGQPYLSLLRPDLTWVTSTSCI
jgi:hypothetical protein